MKNTEECAIYLRKSRSDIELERYNKKIDTLARHEKILRNLCAVDGYNVTKIYREVVSGETINERIEMKRLMADIMLNKYKGVLVVELSRLTRGDKIDQGRIHNIFKYTNTLVITPEKVYNLSNEKDEEAFEDELTNSGKELKTIKKRLNRGRKVSVLEGKYVGNVAPFGYKRVKIKDDKGYTLEELTEEAIVVRKIFDLYVYKDMTKNKIAGKLIELGFKPRKAVKWSTSTIKDILENPVYIGKIRWDYRPEIKSLKYNNLLNEEIVVSRPRNHKPLIIEGIHKPIISNDTWELAQFRLNEGSVPVQTKNSIKNPLAHILICAKCGCYMQRKVYTKIKKEDVVLCNNKYCDNISSKLCIVEDKIIKGLMYWYQNFILSEECFKQKNNINYYQEMIEKLNKNIIINKLKLEKVCEAYEDGIYDIERYIVRSNEIQEKIKQVEGQIIEYKEKINKNLKMFEKNEILIPKIKNIIEIYDKLESPEEKNKLLKTIVEKVIYIKKKKSLKKADDATEFEISIFPKMFK